MSATELIDNLAAELTDWRGKTFADIRRIIREADPEIVEEWKWMGTPVWSHGGIVCIANAFKDKVKLTFDEGASAMKARVSPIRTSSTTTGLRAKNGEPSIISKTTRSR